MCVRRERSFSCSSDADFKAEDNLHQTVNTLVGFFDSNCSRKLTMCVYDSVDSPAQINLGVGRTR